jgi:hypothetical protein
MIFEFDGFTAYALTLPDVGYPSDMCVGPSDANCTLAAFAPPLAPNDCAEGSAFIPDPAWQPARIATIAIDPMMEQRLNISAFLYETASLAAARTENLLGEPAAPWQGEQSRGAS